MPDTFRIEPSTNFRRWSTGARAMAGGFRRHGGEQWQFANEQFFDLTQEFVHILSGDLKATGRLSTELEGVRVVSTVEYGSPEVVYAQYEIDRGGEHDFMGRAWVAAQPVFELVFGKTWNRVVADWDRP